MILETQMPVQRWHAQFLEGQQSILTLAGEEPTDHPPKLVTRAVKMLERYEAEH